MSQRVWLYIGTIAIGLWISATAAGGFLPDAWAEWPVNIWCWGVFAYIYRQAGRKERIEMIAVVALATPMELFFSEVWLVYEYQRDFMPLFVPAGHYFLFDLGRRAASRMRTEMALPLLLPFVPMVAYGAWTGGDTSGVVMLILVLAFTKWGPQPRLYAAMAWAALAMELWGTYLQNWEWAREVPWTGLTAWNPPLLVGAFYCFGDVLVNLCVAKFQGEPTTEVIA
ncbi:MAG: hypothetical protein DWC03_00410 [Candidatus Poseidoniales archaeon]|nr:MAG: hypothetical protein DWC03_00410 [Candidatus Poseidoniales archaeon]